ncbi:nuclear transport factor 2 family protein [Nocardia wallacei]|uniref:nuclear transport factor 2 family protein n=1 Tax=Nocardia wallacei TaxID=480035 RepID=UPI0024563CC6|nr:nuclear transport factor 2 family protein [Nocardia wallacei]
MITAAAANAEQFYAEQVHALDRADFAAYAATFLPDAVFRIVGARTLLGRAQIVEHSRTLRAQRSARNAVQRHYMSNFSVDPTASGARVRAIVLTVESAPGQPARPTGIISCEDILARDSSGRYLVELRTATRLA